MTKLHYEELFKLYITKQLKKIEEEHKGVITANDKESLHQMRTAMRRLRSALWIFKFFLSKSHVEAMRKSLQGFAQASGKARDLDVETDYLVTLKKKLKTPGLKSGMDTLICFLEAQRHSMQPEIAKALSRVEEEKTLKKIKKAIHRVSKSFNSEFLEQFLAIGQKRIIKRLNNMLGQKCVVYESHNTEELHRLRIACKKLRYTLESFELMYGEPIVKYRDAAHMLQTLLGRIHDFDVWLAALPRFVEKQKADKDIIAAVNYFQEKCIHQRGQAYRRLVRYWEKLETQKIWDVLSAFIHERSQRRSH